MGVNVFAVNFSLLYTVSNPVSRTRYTVCIASLHTACIAFAYALRAFLGLRIGEAGHPGPGGPGPALPAMPAAPPGAVPLDPGAEQCFRRVETEVSAISDRKIKSTKRAMVDAVTEFYVCKLAALECVLDSNGADVGCYTDAEFTWSKWVGDVKTVDRERLTPQVHTDSDGEHTLRIKCSEKSGAALYARMIVAWAFNRGQGPEEFEVFKNEGWEGDHLICSDAWTVPLGRASVVCGWIKGVTKRRHIWEEWLRKAAARLAEQSEAYAECFNEDARERACLQKERDEASTEHEKAKRVWMAARERKKVKEHVLVQYRLEEEEKKKKIKEIEARMKNASPRLQRMWQQYVNEHKPPELTWKSRLRVLWSLTLSLLLHS